MIQQVTTCGHFNFNLKALNLNHYLIGQTKSFIYDRIYQNLEYRLWRKINRKSNQPQVWAAA